MTINRKNMHLNTANPAEDLFNQFLTSEYATAQELEDDGTFIPTTAAKTIIARLRMATEQRFAFALVHGPAGSGKTSTVRWYADKHNHTYIRAYPNFEASGLLDEIAYRLRITRTRNFRALIGMVRDALELRPSTIAIDEAQLCSRQALELMKYLADETGSTFVLITTDEFVSALRRWRDIESRVGVVAGIGALELSEFTELYSESGFTPDTLREVHALAGGVMRDVIRLVRQIDHVIDLNSPKLERQRITAKNVKAIASKLNLTGGA